MNAIVVPIMNVMIVAWFMQRNVKGDSRTSTTEIVEANEKRLLVNISLFECILVVAPWFVVSRICNALSADWDMKNPIEFPNALAKPPIIPVISTS